MFCYWDQFVCTIVSVLFLFLIRRSRENNWDLHESCVTLYLSLIFPFDKANYGHWCTEYYDDCLKLQGYPYI